MPTVSVTMTVNRESMANLEKRLRKPLSQEGVDRIFQLLEDTHAYYFQEETGPDGGKWEELRPSTIARKGHDKILFESGDLLDSLTGRAKGAIRRVSTSGTKVSLRFGSDIPYSKTHQYGTDRLPQRKHIGITEVIRELLREIVVEDIKRRLGK